MDILGGFTLESETLKAAKDLNSKIRSRERFFDNNRKYDLARSKFQRSQIVKAKQLYQSLPINLVAVPEDRFVESYVAEQIKIYDSRKEERIEAIMQRIARGYEKNVSRLFISESWTCLGNVTDPHSCFLATDS